MNNQKILSVFLILSKNEFVLYFKNLNSPIFLPTCYKATIISNLCRSYSVLKPSKLTNWF